MKLLFSNGVSFQYPEVMTAVCSVGLDMIGVPGDTTAFIERGGHIPVPIHSFKN